MARVRLLGRDRHQVCRHTDSVHRLSKSAGPRCGGKEVVLTSERSHLARGGELRLKLGVAVRRGVALGFHPLLAGVAIRPEGAGRCQSTDKHEHCRRKPHPEDEDEKVGNHTVPSAGAGRV